MTRRLILMLFLFPLWPPLSTSGQEESDTPLAVVFGRVVDSRTGTPLEGVLVQPTESEQFALTGSDGYFTLSLMSPGVQMLRASGYGFTTLEQEINVRDGVFVQVALWGDPVALEGITVQLDRLERRRRSIPYMVSVLDRELIARTPAVDTESLIRRVPGLRLHPCGDVDWCTMTRGRRRVMSVWLNEVPQQSGFLLLNSIPPNELHALEVIPACAMVRVYTKGWVDGAGQRPRPLEPVFCNSGIRLGPRRAPPVRLPR